ncbi:3-phosphoshikimate 1-carboxyvinyltransferase [Sphingosinicella sp.]|uniref:3-phosphoshikimate 1-carboxyvinyltransferase n=1 Tax=Sphingosinicella sp. TaxID=1917971 RepID=UPI0040380074
MRAPAVFGPRGPLSGTARLPGDKSISHRALILATLAVGTSRISGLNEGEDVAATAAALRALGVRIERESGGWAVTGVGLGTLLQPPAPLDCGNSGTTARLLMGLIASHPIRAELIGDASLSRRPMASLAAPLRRLGARIDGDRLPLAIEGSAPAIPMTHRLNTPSAQVKSALLLAGLNTRGVTTVISPAATRDHLERMLPLFGLEVAIDGLAVRLRGEPELKPCTIAVPGDASAAAFLAVAATIVPGSAIELPGVGVNPGRIGWIEALREMGADISLSNQREESAEPVADLIIRHAPLSAIDLAPGRVPGLIDEIPILAIAAAGARGTSRQRGLAALRDKESDRIATTAAGLAAIGVRAEIEDDDLIVHGIGEAPFAGGATVAAEGDHRIAMAFAVAGLHGLAPLTVDDMTAVSTSFPGFAAALDGLAGA